jgi:hypothetical protein
MPTSRKGGCSAARVSLTRHHEVPPLAEGRWHELDGEPLQELPGRSSPSLKAAPGQVRCPGCTGLRAVGAAPRARDDAAVIEG